MKPLAQRPKPLMRPQDGKLALLLLFFLLGTAAGLALGYYLWSDKFAQIAVSDEPAVVVEKSTSTAVTSAPEIGEFARLEMQAAELIATREFAAALTILIQADFVAQTEREVQQLD